MFQGWRLKYKLGLEGGNKQICTLALQATDAAPAVKLMYLQFIHKSSGILLTIQLIQFPLQTPSVRRISLERRKFQQSLVQLVLQLISLPSLTIFSEKERMLEKLLNSLQQSLIVEQYRRNRSDCWRWLVNSIGWLITSFLPKYYSKCIFSKLQVVNVI